MSTPLSRDDKRLPLGYKFTSFKGLSYKNMLKIKNNCMFLPLISSLAFHPNFSLLAAWLPTTEANQSGGLSLHIGLDTGQFQLLI